jgi:hypothetical protein
VVNDQKSFRCFGIDASDVIIDGFTIQNGDHDFGQHKGRPYFAADIVSEMK